MDDTTVQFFRSYQWLFGYRHWLMNHFDLIYHTIFYSDLHRSNQRWIWNRVFTGLVRYEEVLSMPNIVG